MINGRSSFQAFHASETYMRYEVLVAAMCQVYKISGMWGHVRLFITIVALYFQQMNITATDIHNTFLDYIYSAWRTISPSSY